MPRVQLLISLRHLRQQKIAMSDFEYLYGLRCAVRQRALANRIYQQERQRIFEMREGFIKVISILAGSYAFAKMTNPEVVGWCAVAITTSSAASLVFGFGTKARDSAKRSSEWALLERDIELPGERNFTEDQVAQWTSRCNEIEAGEPAAHPGLLSAQIIVLARRWVAHQPKSRGGRYTGPQSLFHDRLGKPAVDYWVCYRMPSRLSSSSSFSESANCSLS